MITGLTNHTYLVYVSLFNSNITYNDVSIKIFSPFYNWPVYHLHAPSVTQSKYWAAFCYDGSLGIKGIYPLNSYSAIKPNLD